MHTVVPVGASSLAFANGHEGSETLAFDSIGCDGSERDSSRPHRLTRDCSVQTTSLRAVCAWRSEPTRCLGSKNATEVMGIRWAAAARFGTKCRGRALSQSTVGSILAVLCDSEPEQYAHYDKGTLDQQRSGSLANVLHAAKGNTHRPWLEMTLLPYRWVVCFPVYSSCRLPSGTGLRLRPSHRPTAPERDRLSPLFSEGLPTAQDRGK